MIATILDYGAGNLHSLRKALATARDVDARIVGDPRRALNTDLLVLPGVGAFAHAARHLAPARDEIRRAIRGGLPTIGICLGMQLLFASSEEGEGEGLGVIEGRVTRLAARRVPHIGWNDVETVRDDGVPGAAGLRTVYYANSFACRVEREADVVAWTTHESDRFPAIVRRGNVAGMQFHPEKSSAPGVEALIALARAVAA